MQLLKLEKVRDGKYLKNYELTYLNKAGKEKKYEIVSHREIETSQDLGNHLSGVSIVAIDDMNRMLLLREFRMAVNRPIFNLCAGMKTESEDIVDCIKRELFEETGLTLDCILHILPPSFAAVSISDIKNQIAFVKVKGIISDHTSDNEQINAAFYSKDEVLHLLRTEEFSSRAQMAAFLFTQTDLSSIENNL